MPFGLFKRKKKDNKSDSQYLNLTVKEVVRETKDAVSIVFEQPTTGDLNYQSGQFLTLIMKVGGKKIRRAYSLSSSAFLNENPTVTVKRVKGGLMSNYINDEVKAGDVIEVMEPMGSFTLTIDAQQNRQVFLFGGGSGITPLISIAKSILNQESNSKVVLVYANSDEESIIFKQAIRSIKQDNSNRLEVVHFLENAPEAWDGYTGYMTPDALKEIVAKHKDANFSDVEYMTCGPAPMMDVVMETLEALKISEDKKHKESFEAGKTSPDSIIDKGGPKEVTVLLEGEEYKFEVPAKKTILEAGLDENIDMPYSCQSGLCTACRGKCTQGTIRMTEDHGLSSEEKKEGYVLLCMGHPVSDDVVVEIG